MRPKYIKLDKVFNYYFFYIYYFVVIDKEIKKKINENKE